MFQPSTNENAESAQPERETVIKFVISGPFLNAEATHAQWAAEPAPDASVMQELVRRIADLERKLDEERALVEVLARQMPAAAVSAPARLAPGPADFAPVPDHVAPVRADVAPVPAHLAPVRADVAPVPAHLAPVRADVAPVPDLAAPPPLHSLLAEPPSVPAAEPEPTLAVEFAADPAPRTIAAPPPPPPLSTVAQTPPPKIRGLRRMIGALRGL